MKLIEFIQIDSSRSENVNQEARDARQKKQADEKSDLTSSESLATHLLLTCIFWRHMRNAEENHLENQSKNLNGFNGKFQSG